MDLQVQNWLKEANLQHFHDKFVDEGIDASVLAMLTDEQLKELIPKLGDRVRLKAVINSHAGTLNSIGKTVSTADTIIIDPQVTADLSQVEGSYEFANFNELETKLLSVPSTSSNIPSSNVQPSPNAKRIKLTKSFGNLSLEEFLQSEFVGRTIIATYQRNGKILPTERRKLVHLIIDGLMERQLSVSRDILSEVADEIIDIFPTESKNVYFFCFYNGKRRISSGKLVDRYRNQRHYLRKNALIPEPIVNSIKAPVVVTEPVKNKVLFLQHSIEPWDKVCKYWKETVAVREDQRLAEESAYSFLEKWPALKHNLGYVLVSTSSKVILPSLNFTWKIQQYLFSLLSILGYNFFLLLFSHSSG